MSSAASSDAPAPPSAASSAAASKRSTYTDTALHVLKGAIVNVLGPSAALTASVKFEHATKAQLTIVWPDATTLSADTVLAIEKAANDIIRQALPVRTEVRPRKEAETFYSAHPVNHTFIYDKFPVPADVDPLTLTVIDGVNVNCCRGPHTATTAELRALKILKTKKSKQKEKDGTLSHQYEFLFSVHSGAEDGFAKAKEEAARSMKAGAAAASAAAAGEGGRATGAAEPTAVKAGADEEKGSSEARAPVRPSGAAGIAGMPAFERWRPSTRSHIQREADELLALLKEKGLAGDVVDAMQADLERRLTMFSNVCYSMGYQAATDVTVVPRSAMLL